MQCVCFLLDLALLLLQTDDIGVSGHAVKPWLVCVCVCQLSPLYVLRPVGFLFVMWQESDGVMLRHTLCVHLFVCASPAGRHCSLHT